MPSSRTSGNSPKSVTKAGTKADGLPKAKSRSKPDTPPPAIQVGVLMGSSSDWETMQHAAAILAEFGIAHECRVVSAHRMPDDMFAYAEAAAARGLKAIIAGAGGAAHLPGMLAAKTTVPVLNGPTGGGSFISGAQSPFMTFNPGFPDVAGNYFCIVYGGCSDAATPIWSVTVITSAPLPGPAPLPLSICQNGSAGWNVTGLNPSAGPFTHQWYFESPANSNNWLPLVDGPTTLSFGVPGGIVSGATTSAFRPTSFSLLSAV